MALQKPDGVRPIAVGEVLQYLLAKCFCNVAAPLGSEVGSQTVRQWCEPNNATESKIIFLADLAQEH